MWFEKLVGFREGGSADLVRENLRVEDGVMTSRVNGRSFRCGFLETPSLAGLRDRSRISAPTASTSGALQGRTTLSEIVANVTDLHRDPGSRGAVFQVASQFNLLEMLGPAVTPEQGVDIYERDATQGPACAIACGAGTIYRNYFAEVEPGQIGQASSGQIDCLRDLGLALGNENGDLWSMRNGYALATGSGLERIATRIASVDAEGRDKLLGCLRVGVHRDVEVTHGDSQNIVTQIYCSALPVAYSSHSTFAWEAFARLVLEGAYEATLLAAHTNARRTGNNRVFLTLLGGGAFGNHQEWIMDAIRRALHLVEDCGLRVEIVSWGGSNPDAKRLVQDWTSDAG